MTTIYVPLLDEGVDCYRPVSAKPIAGDLYEILDDTPEDEKWPFSRGEIVNCVLRRFGDGATGLVALAKSSKTAI